MSNKGRQSGYVALLAVLVMGAVSTAASLTLLVTGTDSQRSTLVTQRTMQARNAAEACVEEALQQIHDDTAFTGTDNLTINPATCTVTVTNTGGSNRTIVATGTVENIVRKIQVYVTIGSSSISITSWQEVI